MCSWGASGTHARRVQGSVATGLLGAWLLATSPGPWRGMGRWMTESGKAEPWPGWGTGEAQLWLQHTGSHPPGSRRLVDRSQHWEVDTGALGRDRWAPHLWAAVRHRAGDCPRWVGTWFPPDAEGRCFCPRYPGPG